jgi:hypothetical protein
MHSLIWHAYVLTLQAACTDGDINWLGKEPVTGFIYS